MTITTRRLRITPMSDEELRGLIEATNDEDLAGAYREMLDGCEKHPESRLLSTAWKIEEKKAPGKRIGDACFKGAPKAGHVEIGYGMEPGYEGKGYMTEAARALTDWALRQKDVYFVDAETAPENKQSQNVLEKIGFCPTGEVGEEGPRYTITRPVTPWAFLGFCVGMGVGCLFCTIPGGYVVSYAVTLVAGIVPDILARRKRKKLLTALK